MDVITLPEELSNRVTRNSGKDPREIYIGRITEIQIKNREISGLASITKLIEHDRIQSENGLIRLLANASFIEEKKRELRWSYTIGISISADEELEDYKKALKDQAAQDKEEIDPYILEVIFGNLDKRFVELYKNLN